MSRSSRIGWVALGVVVLALGAAALLSTRGGGHDAPTEPQIAGGLPPYDATADGDPAIGQVIPPVTGSDASGEPIEIAPDGTAKVLVFVAHWCPHCQREVPLLSEHLADQPLPDDVELITVSTSAKPGAENYPPERWLAHEGWTAPVIADDQANTVARTFGLNSFPYFVAIDADGKVVSRVSGELSTERFDALVDDARRGEAS